MYRSVLALLIFFSTPLFANTQAPVVPLSVTEGNVSGVVAGCVSAVAGIYFESETDVIIPGPEPLAFQRSYASIIPYGWSNNIMSYVSIKNLNAYNNDIYNCSVQYMAPSGSTVVCSYKTKAYKVAPTTFDVKNYGSGLTNTGQGTISGRTNPKNYEVDFSVGGKFIVARDGSGEMNTYLKNTAPGLFASYLLYESHRPNGQLLKVDYDKKRNPTKIQMSNQDGTCTYSSFDIREIEANGKSIITLSCSDGRCVKQEYQRCNDKNKFGTSVNLKSVERSNSPKVSYEYIQVPETNFSLLKKSNYPDNRYRQVEYYLNPEVPETDFRYLKVKAIQSPSGCDTKPITTHRFAYTKSNTGGTTEVKDAYGNLTIYEYNAEQRLTAVKTYDGSLYFVERFFWGAKGSQDECNLIMRIVEDGNGSIHLTQSYTYDSKGNVLKEVLKGNICSLGSQDEQVKTFIYSNDGKNLLLTESHWDKTTRYSYYKKTDLIEAKLTFVKSEIVQREFYKYDSNCVNVEMVIDDGTSENPTDLQNVSFRKITRITPKKTKPCLGLPEIIEEFGVDLSTGQEKLIRRLVNNYTKEGYLTKQQVFDAEGMFAYETLKEYDAMGNVIAEKDPLGNRWVKQYDINGNLISEQGPTSESLKQHRYDFMNRCISTEAIIEGKSVVTHHRYDLLGRETTLIDIFGNETHKQYNALGRISQIETFSPSGDIATTRQENDLFGNIIREVDALGGITQVVYNIFNKPLRIQYPDGTVELFQYNCEGLLSKKIDKTGSYTLYTYDWKDRPQRIEVYSSEGQLLKVTENSYSTFHLLKTRNPDGQITSFTYDYAGRQASDTKGTATTSYCYDSLGRLCKTTLPSGLVKCLSYDPKGQVIEEREEDQSGNILSKKCFQYDPEGNRTLVAEATNTSSSCTITSYNSQKLPTKIIDPLGNVTHIHYNYSHLNALGQHVLRKTTIDPLGLSEVVVYTVHGKEESIEKRNLIGQIIAETLFHYDILGRKIGMLQKVYEGSEYKYNVLTEWEYDPTGKVLQLTEAKGGLEQKITRNSYNTLGQKECVIKPDGTRIIHTYDSLGRLLNVHSSDKTIDDTFTYDAMDRPILVINAQGLKTVRKYNDDGHLSYEKLLNGLEISYEYDSSGRPIQVKLPDQSTISYTYHAHRMYAVSRGTYTHTYREYDLQGNVTKSELCGEAGSIETTWDLIQRPTAIASRHFTQKKFQYDSKARLTGYESEENSQSFAYDDLSQITQEKGLYTHNYRYDSLYNRKQKDHQSYQHNALNQITTIDANKLEYDPNGNIISWDDNRYQYDAYDRLIAFSDGESHYHYTYDSFNRRMGKILLDGTEEHFIYLGDNEVGKVIDGKVSELRVLGFSRRAEIGASVLIEVEGRAYVPVHNHLGSIAVLIDPETGDLVERYSYSAFGEEANSVLKISPWRFCGKRHDSETGFVNFGRRYYASEIGRWITADPMGYDAGPNLYAYVNNNPLTEIDLYGLWSISFFGSRTGSNPYDHPNSPQGRYARAQRHGTAYHGDRYTNRECCVRRLNSTRDGNLPYHQVIGVGEKYRNKRFICAHGICNSANNVDGMGKFISDRMGTNVHSLCYPSNGFFSDIFDVVLSKFGIVTKKMQGMIDIIRYCYDDIKDQEDLTLVLFAHSGGGQFLHEALRRAGSGVEKMSEIYAFGSAKVFDGKQYLDARNYITSSDPVTVFADPFGFGKGIAKGNVSVLQANRFFDHSMIGGTYQIALDDILQNMNIRYR